MDLVALKAELDAGHPDTGAYDDDAAVATSEINAVNRTKDRETMAPSEVLNAIDISEYGALDPANQDMVWNIIHIGMINPFGVEATLMIGIFGGSTTITTLQALRVRAASRAVELDLDPVRAVDIVAARNLA